MEIKMKKAKKFFEEVIKTKDGKRLINSYPQPKNPEEMIHFYSKIAAELGIDLSEEEITEYFDEKLKSCMASGEVDDDEISEISGGNDSSSCQSSYKNRENCWSNDGCDYVTNNYDTYSCYWSTKGACAVFFQDDNTSKKPSNGRPQKYG